MIRKIKIPNGYHDNGQPRQPRVAELVSESQEYLRLRYQDTGEVIVIPVYEARPACH